MIEYQDQFHSITGMNPILSPPTKEDTAAIKKNTLKDTKITPKQQEDEFTNKWIYKS